MRSLFLIRFLAGSTAVQADSDGNWPRLRGPNGAGVTDEEKFPAEWKAPDYRWQIDLPGIGNGSPVVWGDRIFLLAASEPPPPAPKRKKGKGKNTY